MLEAAQNSNKKDVIKSSMKHLKSNLKSQLKHLVDRDLEKTLRKFHLPKGMNNIATKALNAAVNVGYKSFKSKSDQLRKSALKTANGLLKAGFPRDIVEKSTQRLLKEGVKRAKDQVKQEAKSAAKKAIETSAKAEREKRIKESGPNLENLLVSQQERDKARDIKKKIESSYDEMVKKAGKKAVDKMLNKISKQVANKGGKVVGDQLSKLVTSQVLKTVGSTVGKALSGAVGGLVGGLQDIITAKSPQEKGIAAAKAVIGGIASALPPPLGLIANGIMMLIPNRVSTDNTYIVNQSNKDLKTTMTYNGGKGNEGFKNRNIKARGGKDHDEYRYAGMYGVQSVNVEMEREGRKATVTVPSDTSILVKDGQNGKIDVYTSKYGALRSADEKIGTFDFDQI
ncbi:hypothetical protein AKO1_001023 [Acrasis kona]|uniref:Uncharacterized protein n=1 Tax=Acrasis kona TaxID=1008807 RepID=A0AAW2YUD9_9EUKA